jgi:hypothetical protein
LGTNIGIPYERGREKGDNVKEKGRKRKKKEDRGRKRKKGERK